jgi:hypothetical protein
MKLASILMSSAAITAVFVACGGARDRGPNANDVSATEMPTQPATTPMTTEPNVPGDSATVTGSTGLPAGGGPGAAWTDGPGSPGGERSVAGPPNTNHTNTVTANAGGGVYTGIAQPNPSPIPQTVSAGSGLPTSTGSSIR